LSRRCWAWPSLRWWSSSGVGVSRARRCFSSRMRLCEPAVCYALIAPSLSSRVLRPMPSRFLLQIVRPHAFPSS